LTACGIGNGEADFLRLSALRASERNLCFYETTPFQDPSYSDNGATVVRAWIGTEDRTLSAVGKGSYTASNDVYDIHAVAPSPLPENVKWWVSLEKPDGTEITGSIEPKL
jgi:hypothetical protein